ncbi:MAG: hypothetical protein B6U97_01120 [Candidatus Altiarchaeales archaeon ex4484_96]|nr:MAG: hypothetical protein B6U97_01120 [Candidatus Altiarchaeales archaeon ex4484_96]
MKRTITGIKGLDLMLKGGIPKNRVVLISGSTGTGKTTIGMQFIYNGIVDHNEAGVYITLEEDKQQIKQDINAQGMNLDSINDRFRFIGGHIATIQRFKRKTKANVEDLVNEVEEVVHEIGAKRVVLDPVNLFLMLFDSDNEKRDALALLTEKLKKLNCTTLLLCEVKEQSMDISREGFEEFVADGVITLYNLRCGPSFYQGIAVRKMRGIEHHREIRPYEITNEGVVVYQTQPWLPPEE